MACSLALSIFKAVLSSTQSTLHKSWFPMLTKGILRDALTWVYQVEHSSPSHRVESSRGALGKKNRSLFASCFLFEQFLSEMFHISWHCWTKKTNKKTLHWLLSVLVDLSSSLKSRNQKLLQIQLAVKRPQRLWNGKELHKNCWIKTSNSSIFTLRTESPSILAKN